MVSPQVAIVFQEIGNSDALIAERDKQQDVIVSHLTGTILDTGQLSPFSESANSPAFAPQSQAI
jgi:hypothetical protein